MKKFMILFTDHLINSWRTKKGILFLIIYTAVFLLCAYGIIRFQIQINSQMENLGVPEMQKQVVTELAKNILKNSINNAVVTYLLSIPFMNIALFLVSLFGTPLLILLLKYDVISQEDYEHTTRFLLFRCSRIQIYLAKYFSSIIEIMILTFTALFVALTWAAFSIPDFSFAESFKPGFHFFIVSQLLFSVIIAIVQLISVIVKKPVTGLLISAFALIVLLIIPVWVSWVSPFDINYTGGLFAGKSDPLMVSAAGYLAFNLMFLSSGYLIYRRKNI